MRLISPIRIPDSSPIAKASAAVHLHAREESPMQAPVLRFGERARKAVGFFCGEESCDGLPLVCDPSGTYIHHPHMDNRQFTVHLFFLFLFATSIRYSVCYRLRFAITVVMLSHAIAMDMARTIRLGACGVLVGSDQTIDIP